MSFLIKNEKRVRYMVFIYILIGYIIGAITTPVIYACIIAREQDKSYDKN